MAKKLAVETPTQLETLDTAFLASVADYSENIAKFRVKGNKAAGARARKALQQIKVAAQEIRVTIQEQVNAAA